MRGLLDTSVLVALEAERTVTDLPDEGAVSVVTVEELLLGVRMAEHRGDAALISTRRATLEAVERAFEALPVTRPVAVECARIRAEGRAAGIRFAPFDALIAATAVVHELVLYTQDAALERLPGVNVRVV
jgi:predicted nucleic acid-binding protein